MIRNGASADELEKTLEDYPYLFSEERDCDVYEWLRELAPYSPVIHLQQTDGKRSAHLPFNETNNRNGIITGEKVLSAIAEAYAAAGATIVFNDINRELVDKGLKAYAEKKIDAKGYVCDVTDEEAVQALVKQIEAEVGVIDILVNNAGIIRRIPMTEMSAAEFRFVIPRR